MKLTNEQFYALYNMMLLVARFASSGDEHPTSMIETARKLLVGEDEVTPPSKLTMANAKSYTPDVNVFYNGGELKLKTYDPQTHFLVRREFDDELFNRLKLQYDYAFLDIQRLHKAMLTVFGGKNANN